MNALHVAALCLVCFMVGVMVVNFWGYKGRGGKGPKPNE